VWPFMCSVLLRLPEIFPEPHLPILRAGKAGQWIVTGEQGPLLKAFTTRHLLPAFALLTLMFVVALPRPRDASCDLPWYHDFRAWLAGSNMTFFDALERSFALSMYRSSTRYDYAPKLRERKRLSRDRPFGKGIQGEGRDPVGSRLIVQC